MGNSSRESLFCSLLAFLCLGLTSAVSAFDDPASPAGQPGKSVSPGVLTGEIAGQVEYWSAHCGELEAGRRNIEASRCWWYAAEELNRYVRGDHPAADEVRELRRDWLWRGVRLSRQLLEPKRPAAVEPPAVPPAGVDPAPVAVAASCASISSDDGMECLVATPAVLACGHCACGHCACGHCACGRCACGRCACCEARPIAQESGSGPQGEQEENYPGRERGGEDSTGEESPQEGDFQTSRGAHDASCVAIDSGEKDELRVFSKQAMCRPPFAGLTPLTTPDSSQSP